MIETLTTQGPLILFYVFAAVAVLGALMVVTLRNPMYSALSLLVSFLAVAVLFLLRYAELLAVVQVFVYGGGVMVLFLFVIMLVNLHRLEETHLFFEHRGVAIGLVTVLAVAFFLLLSTAVFGPPPADPLVVGAEPIAMTLYTRYLLPFEVASIFLLVAMVGAVVLGRKD